MKADVERLEKLMEELSEETARTREQIIQAAQAGVNDYIVKPFTPDTLKAKIEKIFKGVAGK